MKDNQCKLQKASRELLRQIQSNHSQKTQVHLPFPLGLYTLQHSDLVQNVKQLSVKISQAMASFLFVFSMWNVLAKKISIKINDIKAKCQAMNCPNTSPRCPKGNDSSQQWFHFKFIFSSFMKQLEVSCSKGLILQ